MAITAPNKYIAGIYKAVCQGGKSKIPRKPYFNERMNYHVGVFIDYVMTFNKSSVIEPKSGEGCSIFPKKLCSVIYGRSLLPTTLWNINRTET